MTTDVLPGSGRDAWQSDEEWEPPWSGFEPSEPAIKLVPDAGPSNGTAAAARAKPKTQRAESRSTWSPVDMTTILAGDLTPLETTRWQRSDGVRLLYPGRDHSFRGERETLKSFAAKIAAAEVLNDGGIVLYLDFDTEARDVVGQLQLLSISDEVLASRLLYVRPDEPLTNDSLDALLNALPDQLDLTVIDGVDFGMNLARLNPDKEYLAFRERLINPLQARTSGPLITIDHVAKNREARGDNAAGDRHKENSVTGASFAFELVQHFGRGRVGVAKILLHKDRPGGLRGHQGAGKEIGRLRLTSHPDDSITWELLPPVAVDTDGAASQWMPTALMERCSRLLEGSAKPLSKNGIETAVAGKRDYVRRAVDCLVELGYAEAFTGANRARLHRSVKPYREDTEPPESSSPPVRPQFAPGEQTSGSPLRPTPKGGANTTPTSQEPLLDPKFAPPGRTPHVEAISQ